MNQSAKQRIRTRFDRQALTLYGSAFLVAVVSFVGAIPRLLLEVGFALSTAPGHTHLLVPGAVLIMVAILSAAVVAYQLSGFTKRVPRRLSDRNPSDWSGQVHE